jgi:glycosyltransferase involved in cell wall biosynthesis
MSQDAIRWRLLASHVPAGGRGGGMVRYVVELAAALDRRPDIELSVVTTRGAAPYWRGRVASPQLVDVLPDGPSPARAMLERYSQVVDRGGPYDVVHGTKHLLPRRSSAIRLLTVHDLVLLDRPRDFGLVKRTLLRRPYLATLREADMLTCVSAATRDRLLRQLPEVAPHTLVVPLAVSSALLDAVPREVPALAGRLFALVVGDSSPRKNLPMLVDCWDRVTERVPQAVLAIAGPPSWTGSGHGRPLGRLRASGQVVALGHVSDYALRWCYENAAVVLCPSRLEGFGLPAVEALAFGAPLITSTDEALCEASGEKAVHLHPQDPDSWVAAIISAMTVRRPASPAAKVRTWDEVAEETVQSVRRCGTRLLTQS